MKKISIALLALATAPAFAEVWLPKIFGDNMVMQADMPNTFWGTAAPKAKIAVSVGGKQFKATANDKGEWVVKTSKLPKNFKPQDIVVSENGAAQKTLKNVLVGEVWILGGQSNMQFILKSSTDYQAALKRINPNVRIFRQPGIHIAKTPQADSPKIAAWEVADEKSIGGAHAVGYYFGEMIASALKTPVGLVETAVGGTGMISWLPREKLTTPSFKETLEKFDKAAESYDYNAAMENYKKQVAAIKAAAKGKQPDAKQQEKLRALARAKPSSPISPWPPRATPCYLYNAKVNPLAGVAARGFVWYQGESDSGANRAKCFAENFEVLVGAWREAWGNKEMPFYFFQLPSFETNALWGETRVQQHMAAKKMKGVYLVPIVDSGEQRDIHPKDKTFVAKRLFPFVMKISYKKSMGSISWAEVASFKISGKKCAVKFTQKIEGKGEPRGFEVLVGGKWQKAGAKIVSPTEVEVSADGDIEAARYLWASWALPEVWLYTAKSGLPVSTFQIGGAK